jgi:hypothetical protein
LLRDIYGSFTVEFSWHFSNEFLLTELTNVGEKYRNKSHLEPTRAEVALIWGANFTLFIHLSSKGKKLLPLELA